MVSENVPFLDQGNCGSERATVRSPPGCRLNGHLDRTSGTMAVREVVGVNGTMMWLAPPLTRSSSFILSSASVARVVVWIPARVLLRLNAVGGFRHLFRDHSIVDAFAVRAVLRSTFSRDPWIHSPALNLKRLPVRRPAESQPRQRLRYAQAIYRQFFWPISSGASAVALLPVHAAARQSR